ncbi:hypothetical protein [Chitinophaga silvisoli]|uniref:Uncharacterized protein n=1 Tax=Chitinophaga silvisoli TaxID=2291814 RepID=A0A3E1NY65_9BACT|nr:hypothetical protein [Chitinophaga silvisoli]RFM32869.1 hypothetical protein DXN04_20715 [Chitinophaga silvisoli]
MGGILKRHLFGGDNFSVTEHRAGIKVFNFLERERNGNGFFEGRERIEERDGGAERCERDWDDGEMFWRGVIEFVRRIGKCRDLEGCD